MSFQNRSTARDAGSNQDNSNNSDNAGSVGGGIAGGVAAAVFLGIVLTACYRKRGDSDPDPLLSGKNSVLSMGINEDVFYDEPYREGIGKGNVRSPYTPSKSPEITPPKSWEEDERPCSPVSQNGTSTSDDRIPGIDEYGPYDQDSNTPPESEPSVVSPTYESPSDDFEPGSDEDNQKKSIDSKQRGDPGSPGTKLDDAVAVGEGISPLSPRIDDGEDKTEAESYTPISEVCSDNGTQSVVTSSNATPATQSPRATPTKEVSPRPTPPSGNSRGTTPTESSLPSTPTANSRPTTPTANSRPTTPKANSRPTTPKANSRPTTPAANSGPTTPTANSRPTTPTANSRPTTPKANSRPTTPAASSRPTTPTANSRPTTPTANSRPTTPTANSRPTTPTANSRPSTPATNSRPTTPTANSRPTTPKGNSRPTTPTANSRPTTPTGKSRATTPTVNSRASTPTENSRAATPTKTYPRDTPPSSNVMTPVKRSPHSTPPAERSPRATPPSKNSPRATPPAEKSPVTSPQTGNSFSTISQLDSGTRVTDTPPSDYSGWATPADQFKSPEMYSSIPTSPKRSFSNDFSSLRGTKTPPSRNQRTDSPLTGSARASSNQSPVNSRPVSPIASSSSLPIRTASKEKRKERKPFKEYSLDKFETPESSPSPSRTGSVLLGTIRENPGPPKEVEEKPPVANVKASGQEPPVKSTKDKSCVYGRHKSQDK